MLLAERYPELPLGELERRPWLTLLLDGCADRGDLGRGRAAAAADHLRAEVTSMRRELGEVLGSCMGIDDAPACEAGEADVRERRERASVLLHLLERLERR